MHRHDQSRRQSSRKTRKRGCSSSSSCSSSLVQGYRFKKAVVVSTPLWRQSPRYTAGEEVWDGRVSRPVSARKLAATLWGMNEAPSPAADARRGSSKERRSSSSFPPHLSDPSHSPTSERMGGSRPGSVRRSSPAMANVIKRNAAIENETRSRRGMPRGSTVGVRDRLKDVSNAIMTSKELLKIVDHVWGREEQPLSSVSLVLALHEELERARLQLDQLLHEQRCSGQMDVSLLIKQFAEEKAALKVREREVVEGAIQSIARELEGERRLRRRFENLNKKLGADLACLKASFQKVAEELESEKRTRQILEQVCDELAGNIGDDKAQLEQLKMESEKALEEVEKEREMLRLADSLREERVQMKLSEAKHEFEEKNAAVVKLKKELETLLKPRKGKGKAGGSSQSGLDRGSSAEIVQFLDNMRFATCDDEDDFGQRSVSGRRSSKRSSLQKRRVKDVHQNLEHELERNLSSGYEKRLEPKHDLGDAMHKYPNRRDSPIRFVSPVRQWGQVRPPRDPHHAISEMHSQVYSAGSRSRFRLSDATSETKSRR